VQLKWTRAASLDLESVEEFISRENPAAAIRMILEIIRRAEALADHPGMGRPGRIDGTRELVLAGLPYTVPHIHLEGEDMVIILRVFHRAMKWSPR
jgi:toxin ParE1/3/4